MILLGLVGKAQSGKDSIADYLVQNYNFVKFGFTFHLKNVAEVAGWDGQKDERGRRFLQHLGDVLREYDKDIFLKYFEDRIKILLYTNGLKDEHIRVVVPDIRLIEEVKFIKKSAGFIWSIQRGEEFLDANLNQHKTEKELEMTPEELIDKTITNYDSIGDLYLTVDEVVQNYL